MTGPTLHYTTPIARIGRHEWQVIVLDMPARLIALGCRPRCTDWRWRRAGESAWRALETWPGYDDNKSDGGMPRGCAAFYSQHVTAIKQALGERAAEPATAQLQLL